MTHQDALKADELIGTLTEAIMLMERQEVAFYDYLADNAGAVDAWNAMCRCATEPDGV